MKLNAPISMRRTALSNSVTSLATFMSKNTAASSVGRKPVHAKSTRCPLLVTGRGNRLLGSKTP
jgi:hypothetical protein